MDDRLEFGSPIEAAFAQGVEDHGGMQFVPTFGLAYEEIRGKAATILAHKKAAVFPQVRIAKYTVDFMVLFWERSGLIAPIIVECDGHEFHERTPQQAQHDKRRDRFFACNSIFVMRFTGREIKRDAFECAREVYRAAEFVSLGPSAQLRGVQWLLSDAEIEAAMEDEVAAEYAEQRERDEFARFASAEIMSGTFEGYYP